MKIIKDNILTISNIKKTLLNNKNLFNSKINE